MQKLIRGIMEFRNTRRQAVRDLFAQLALGQSPDCLFIACSDSRVAANVFASTDPGDLFVVRNPGNIVPPHPSEDSAVVALEFALELLKVRHVVVCGHSDCGAISALVRNRQSDRESSLAPWLRHALPAASDVTDLDQISKRNVSLQLEHLRSHPLVREREREKTLQLHGIWFDIRSAEVYYLERPPDEFVLIDQNEGQRILDRLGELTG